MITFKQQLTKKKAKEIFSLLQSLEDIYSDFYLTKNNLRLYIKENFKVLLDNLQKGDFIVYCDEGVAILVGFAEKQERKYIKFLVKNSKVADKLLKFIGWHFNIDLYCKLKWKNDLKKALLRNGFVFKAGRGHEVLLVRPKRKKYILNINKEFDK